MDVLCKFGFKLDQVKDIMQVLCEKYKFIIYNCFDCEYLSEEQYGDVLGVLVVIVQMVFMLVVVVQCVNLMIKSCVFNLFKVFVYYVIILIESMVDLLKFIDVEQKIYLLIVCVYVVQFWLKYLYDQIDVFVQVGDYCFGVCLNVIMLLGWKIFYKNDVGNEDLEGNVDDIEQDLCKLCDGQVGICIDVKVEQQEMKLQLLYMMEFLLLDFICVVKYICDDCLWKILIEKDKGK